MTAATYTTNLADIFTDGTTTGWTAIGGGQSALAQETDYFIQGTSCLSKGAWASATKGAIYSHGSDAGGSSTDGAYFMWITHLTPNSLAVKSSGGIQMLIGSATGAYEQYYVGGSDTIEFGGWIIAAVSETIAGDATTGSPSATIESYFGGLANLPTGGPTKGAPFGIDAIRFGRGDAIIEHGTGADTEADFDGIVSSLGSVSNRYGLLSLLNGVYYNSGLLQFGSATNAVEFKDANKTIMLRDHDHVTANFHTWEVVNASSIITLDNLVVQALGTTSRGRWITTDNATVDITSCSFTDMGAFTFDTNTTAHLCTFRRCDVITPAGGDLTHCVIEDTNVSANASAVIWNVATDPDVPMGDMTISKGTTATHAIEFGTTSPLTMTVRNIDFSGYNAANGQNDSTFHVKRTAGTVTINIIGGSGNVSYRSDGATVNVVVNPVTFKVIMQKPDGTLITDSTINIEVLADTGGDLTVGTEIIRTVTDSNGEVADTRTYTADQPVSGWARGDLATPNYRQTDISGTISKDNGLELTFKMVEE